MFVPETAHRPIAIVFSGLVILTGLELSLASVPEPRTLVVGGLIALALSKAAGILFWYMHLIHETPVLKRTVLIALLLPALYAAVLIGEAVWHSRWSRF